MARMEPSLYEPRDDARIFDGAEESDDEGSRLPLLIVVALLVLAAFAGVVWLAYSQGVARGREGAPQILAAASGPVKVAPVRPGGAGSPYRGLKIYQQPAPKDNDTDTDSAVTTGPAATVVAKPKLPTVSSSSEKHTPEIKDVGRQEINSHPTALLSLRSGAAEVANPDSETKNPTGNRQTTPKSAKTAPPPSPRPLSANQEAVVKEQTKPQLPQVNSAPTTATPVQLHPAPAGIQVKAPPQPLATANNVTPAATVGYVLQIGSFKSETEAMASWERFKSKHAALVGNYGPNVQSVDLGAKGTWYRLRMESFPDKNTAADVCMKLRADGASCLLGR